MYLVGSLAIAQLITQLLFFLHLEKEPKPRWNLLVLSFAVTVAVILVFGSLWIMQNLNYRHGGHNGSQYSEAEIIEDEGFHHH
jgi:heme/copper-type cytochrome/quinol oxidase subunit 4